MSAAADPTPEDGNEDAGSKKVAAEGKCKFLSQSPCALVK